MSLHLDPAHERPIPVIPSTFPIPSLATPEDCIAFAQRVNPRKEALTIETLKRFPGCEHYNDAEAAEIVEAIHQLTAIIFAAVYESGTIGADNLVSIPINIHKSNNLAA